MNRETSQTEGLRNAPRCGARTRAGQPCQKAALRGKKRCRLHGGAPGSGGPSGNRNGAFRHGLATRTETEARRALSTLLRDVKPN
ncbi:HGGxSTG domain-containing protein [Alsobacter sp. SYSU BS001988]